MQKHGFEYDVRLHVLGDLERPLGIATGCPGQTLGLNVAALERQPDICAVLDARNERHGAVTHGIFTLVEFDLHPAIVVPPVPAWVVFGHPDECLTQRNSVLRVFGACHHAVPATIFGFEFDRCTAIFGADGARLELFLTRFPICAPKPVVITAHQGQLNWCINLFARQVTGTNINLEFLTSFHHITIRAHSHPHRAGIGNQARDGGLRTTVFVFYRGANFVTHGGVIGVMLERHADLEFAVRIECGGLLEHDGLARCPVIPFAPVITKIVIAWVIAAIAFGSRNGNRDLAITQAATKQILGARGDFDAVALKSNLGILEADGEIGFGVLLDLKRGNGEIISAGGFTVWIDKNSVLVVLAGFGAFGKRECSEKRPEFVQRGFASPQLGLVITRQNTDLLELQRF